MAWLEAAKQETFSDETLKVWRIEMQRLGWTDGIFRERVSAVMRSTTFGKVKFEDFINSECLYTGKEVAGMIEQKINIRKAEYLRLKNFKVPDEQLVAEGLASVQSWWQTELNQKLDEIKDQINARCRELRKRFSVLPQEKKDTLLSIAIDKGLIVKDSTAMEILPLLIPQMMEDFEKVL